MMPTEISVKDPKTTVIPQKLVQMPVRPIATLDYRTVDGATAETLMVAVIHIQDSVQKNVH